MRTYKDNWRNFAALLLLLLVGSGASAGDWVKVNGVTHRLNADNAVMELPGNSDLSTQTVEAIHFQWLFSNVETEILMKVAQDGSLQPDPEKLKQLAASSTSAQAKESMAGTLAGLRFTAAMVPMYRRRFGDDLSEGNKAAFYHDVQTAAAAAKVRKGELFLSLDELVPDNGKLEEVERYAGLSVEQLLATASSGNQKAATEEAATKHIVGSFTVSPEEMKRGKAIFESEGGGDHEPFDKWIQTQKRYHLLRKEILRRIQADAEFSSPEFRRKALEHWGAYNAKTAPIFEPQ